jgi:NADH-quinone oxidoreductase subunit M
MTLLCLLLVPFIGGVLCWLLQRVGARHARYVALGSMAVILVLVVGLWLSGDYSQTLLPGSGPGHWVLELSVAWIPRLGIRFSLGLDGLSLLLIALTALLGMLSVACSWQEIQTDAGFFYMNVLWNLAGVIGVFLATDLFLFFLSWEVMLVPMFFLIALWGHDIPGGRPRLYAALKFFIFTQSAGLVMLVAILALVFVHYRASEVLTFGYSDLLATPMDARTAFWIMLGLFVGFAAKLPVVPLHSWLPDAHSQAPTAGSVILAGILLKTAAYGLLRYLLPLFPAASAQFAPIAMWLGVLGIIYGAVCAYGQNDTKRLVAYTSVSHMGFIVLGVFAGTQEALQGVIMQILAHGISAAGLFVLCGELYERLGTRDLTKMGGLWGRFSKLPQFGLFFILASLGLPGLGNFLGEFLILLGTFKAHPQMAMLGAVGLVLSAVYSLILMQRIFYGKASAVAPLPDLDRREFAILSTLMAVMIWLGLYPRPFFEVSRAPMRALQVLYAPDGAAPTGASATSSARVAP